MTPSATLQPEICLNASGEARVMSTTELPLHATQVLAEPLFTNMGQSSPAHSDSARPRALDLRFPHSEECALKSPRTGTCRGRRRRTQSPTPFRNSSNAVHPLIRAAHHHHSCPLNRDVYVAALQQGSMSERPWR